MYHKSYCRALTIAGSDSGGGAGIQADLKTFSALGCYGMSVITALTAQNTVGVHAIHPVPADFIADQLSAVIADIGADAVKIGMLHSPAVIQVVAKGLRAHQPPHQVLDPVMVAKSGDRLLQEEAIAALKAELLPLADLITPNLPEAYGLVGQDPDPAPETEAMRELCRELAGMGPPAVLLKGGHLGGENSPDLLYLREEDRFLRFEAERIQTANTHGTGCTLSSAIAAHLARGEDLATAVEKGKFYLTAALKAGADYRLGAGHGPVHHFYALNKPRISL